MSNSISASLAFCNSATLLPSLSALLFNPSMANVKDTRRANLIELARRHGSIAEFARMTDTDPIYLRQIKDRSPDSKTGRPRAMGDRVAAKIEAALAMEPGAMDSPLRAPAQEPTVRAEMAVVGTFEQLEADWRALPEGWRFHVCRKTRKLREMFDAIPPFVRDSLKPIEDNSNYHDWERKLEESLAEKERRDEEEIQARWTRNHNHNGGRS